MSINQRLIDRIEALLKMGRVKDPELLVSTLECLSDLADATECLLDDMGKPEDGIQTTLMDRCRRAIAVYNGKNSKLEAA